MNANGFGATPRDIGAVLNIAGQLSTRGGNVVAAGFAHCGDDAGL
jgi:hypothetical protein